MDIPPGRSVRVRSVATRMLKLRAVAEMGLLVGTAVAVLVIAAVLL